MQKVPAPVTSTHAGGSRAFVAPLPAAKAQPEGSWADGGATVSGDAAPSATATRSSSAEPTGGTSGGPGTVTGGESGAASAPAQAAPLIIRDWGSVGGGFVPFGASVQKTAPKGGKVAFLLPFCWLLIVPRLSCVVMYRYHVQAEGASWLALLD